MKSKRGRRELRRLVTGLYLLKGWRRTEERNKKTVLKVREAEGV